MDRPRFTTVITWTANFVEILAKTAFASSLVRRHTRYTYISYTYTVRAYSSALFLSLSLCVRMRRSDDSISDSAAFSNSSELLQLEQYWCCLAFVTSVG